MSYLFFYIDYYLHKIWPVHSYKMGTRDVSLTSFFCKITFCNRVSLRSLLSSDFQRHLKYFWPPTSITLLGALMTLFQNSISQWRHNLKNKRDPINIQNVLWTIYVRSIWVVGPLNIRYSNTVIILFDVYLILPNKEAFIMNWELFKLWKWMTKR